MQGYLEFVDNELLASIDLSQLVDIGKYINFYNISGLKEVRLDSLSTSGDVVLFHCPNVAQLQFVVLSLS